MARTLNVTVKAQADALNALLYYDDKLAGLGDKFIEALERRYLQITQNPQHYSFVFSDKENTLRDVMLEGFPYLVIFDFTDIEVTVYAIHNCYKMRRGF